MNIQNISGSLPQALTQATANLPASKPRPAEIQGTTPPPPPVKQADQADASRAGEASQDTIRQAAEQISNFVGSFNDQIEFSLDDETGQSVLKVIDVQTKEVLRQIPTEEALAISKALDKLQGILIQNKA